MTHERRKSIIIPMHVSYDPRLPAAKLRELRTRDYVLARTLENGEIEPWLPISAEDEEFLNRRVKGLLELRPDQRPKYLDDYVFKTQRPKNYAG